MEPSAVRYGKPKNPYNFPERRRDEKADESVAAENHSRRGLRDAARRRLGREKRRHYRQAEEGGEVHDGDGQENRRPLPVAAQCPHAAPFRLRADVLAFRLRVA